MHEIAHAMSDFWDGVERRKDGRDEFKKAVIEAAHEFWSDRARVQRIVALVLECLTKEIEAGAGRAMFAGMRGAARKVFWVSLVIIVLLYVGGPQAVVAFIKGALST